MRATVEALQPAEYLGVDIAAGPGVDEICQAEELVARYGRESFDVVISTELVEHVKDWRAAIHNMKCVLRPSGTLLLTTRSRGFKVHGYPWDFWRYEPDDMRVIFADMTVETIETDEVDRGVFVKARRPERFVEADLAGIDLYSVVTRSRRRDIGPSRELLFKVRYRAHQGYRRLVSESVRQRVRKLVR